MSQKPFSILNIKPELFKSLETLGYESMTPIQEQSLPVLNMILVALLIVGLYMTFHVWAEVSYSFSCLSCTKGEV